MERARQRLLAFGLTEVREARVQLRQSAEAATDSILRDSFHEFAIDVKNDARSLGQVLHDQQETTALFADRVDTRRLDRHPRREIATDRAFDLPESDQVREEPDRKIRRGLLDEDRSR